MLVFAPLSSPNFSSPIPENILFDLGGYTGFKTREWENYLRREIWKRYPLHFVRQFFSRRKNRWQENDCIYAALKKYLLFEFGILLPEHSLFEVFNRAGQGLLPADILAAVSAVIEPLGLELDHVFALEPRLRKALGFPEKMARPEEAALFDNRAGICMIQIREGYSHAFFWDHMRSARFEGEPFRLALTIRRKRPLRARPAYSILAGMLSFAKMAAACCDASTTGQVRELTRFAVDPASQSSPDFRAAMDAKWETLLEVLGRQPSEPGAREKLGQLLDVARALRTLFQEVPLPGVPGAR